MSPDQGLHLLSSPSGAEWWNFVLVFVGLVAAIGLGEGVRAIFRWSPEFTRKLVHISVGVLIFFAPAIFVTAIPAIVLAVVFIVLNLLAIRLGVLKGMHGTTRPTYGTVYYPLSFLILVLVFWYHADYILSIAILVMAFADAAAAIVGESLRRPREYYLSSDKKSVEGSVTMFAVSFAVVFIGLTYFGIAAERGWLLVLAASFVAALTSTAWEALSARGFDNLSVPLSTALVLALFIYSPSANEAVQLTVGAGLGLVIGVASYRAGFLTVSGSVATFLLASTIYGLGGWKWTVPILAFFVLSSLLSKTGKARKQELSDLFEKGSTRDAGQVFANGGIAGLLAVAAFAFPGWDLYPVYLASVAGVTADTWGTEIGVMARGKTYLITSWKRVAPGVNGGVSVAGLIGGLVGSAVVVSIAAVWLSSFRAALFACCAGFLGSVVDSLLGATLQATYRCSVCGKVTEKRVHCREPAEIAASGSSPHLVRGLGWMNNDAVNWFCALSSALVALLLL